MAQHRTVILVVEDHHFILSNAVEALFEAGFEALAARNADEAIRILETHMNVHVVFTDVEMGGSMDGLKLAHYIRNRWPPVQLIVTSGKMALDEKRLPAGARFFPKPYHDASIIEAIKGMFPVGVVPQPGWDADEGAPDSQILGRPSVIS